MASIQKQRIAFNLKIFAILAGFILTLIAALIAADRYFSSNICNNKVIAEYPSPNGQKKIVLFQRECGATVGFNTQASVIDSGTAIGDNEANLLVTDTDHGAAPSNTSSSTDGPAIIPTWHDNSTISISHHSKIRFYKNEKEIQDIKIQYIQIES